MEAQIASGGDLWGDDPPIRLENCRAAGEAPLKQHVEALVVSCPGGKWPFGMPTSINPYLLFVGISPGKGKESGKDYPPPSYGKPHSGFGGKDAGWDILYWDKIRDLFPLTYAPNGEQ